MNSTKTPSFKETIKSWDTENYLDRIFYRPIGYRLALLLKPTGITPNAITIISIFVGVGACLLFLPDDNLTINLLGFLLLIFANILDCVDGQLARMTGIKSELGRILDGFCGDLWFLTFYTVMAVRLISGDGWGWWAIVVALISGYSHFNQAGMVDYYKTLHLHFLKGGQNSEFSSTDDLRKKYQELTWNKPVSKILMKLYLIYTLNQEIKTPALRSYMTRLNQTYPTGYPESVVSSFRFKSLKLMPLLDTFTFNTRSLIMLVTLLLNVEWVYFAVEILVFNPLLYLSIYRHEKMCASMEQLLKK
jgi:phosphatidylserine synthase